ncbi:GDP-D-glucose phosphorylase 1 [Hemicordylus capensis]|uniref:GDP-D-glucose phosphorylase 1 n=1 Tax=Hemicordylus capensis TaxID=884348 RepID=UPI002303F310|nr:GDP-D-glucose phosphorylase 1 [Hemicordylus capensis]
MHVCQGEQDRGAAAARRRRCRGAASASSEATMGCQPSPERPLAEAFVYHEEDLLLHGVAWQGERSVELAGHAPSHFDQALQSTWEDRLNRGLFRYRLGVLPTRILPGDVGFVAQLNIQRGAERRAPQEIHSVQQSFDPQRFGFSQIRPEEVLFRMAKGCTTPSVPQVGGPGPWAGPAWVLVVINVSPLEFGHVLLVPDPALCLPQVLTAEALAFGLEAVLLSSHPGFRVGFNSLGGFASVNHLHLHGFYLDWELLAESAPCQPLLPPAGLFLLREFPAPAFLFYSQGGRLEGLARRICQVTTFLVRKEVAHNLFVTRGAPPEGPARSPARPGLRILLWARKACFGAKEEAAFNVALCELAGHLPVKSAEEFEGLTEASAIHTIQKYLLPEPQFAQLQRELVALLQE